jgi:hypothetical protein
MNPVTLKTLRPGAPYHLRFQYFRFLPPPVGGSDSSNVENSYLHSGPISVLCVASSARCRERLQKFQDDISYAVFSVCDVGKNVNGQSILHEVPGIKTDPGIAPHYRKHAVVESLLDAATKSLSVIEFSVCLKVYSR